MIPGVISRNCFAKTILNLDEFVLSYSQLRNRPTAEDYHVQNVDSWFYNNPYAIASKERQFIYRGSDVISLVERKKPFLRKAIESIGGDKLAKLFSAKHRPDRVKSENTHYASNTKMDAFETVTLVVISLATLLGPMWWLNFVSDSAKRLSIISVFVILFAGILSSATVRQPFEVMAGTAA